MLSSYSDSTHSQSPDSKAATLQAEPSPFDYARRLSPASNARLVLVVVFMLAALYMATELKRGWIPHDEGALAQSAERALHGQLPHKDFDEVYTGGLTYLNALAFRVFGIQLVSMRYVLYLFFLAWIPAFYYLALRFVSPFLAGATTLLAVVWSVPNYAAAMPSWYNLFFATFGLLATFRYTESDKRQWLFVAGLCGGVSFLFKVSGLYFVAGVLLFLAFREQMGPSTPEVHGKKEPVWYRAFLTASILLFLLVIFSLIRKPFTVISFLYFAVPNVALVLAVIWHEFHRSGNRKERFAHLFSEAAFFGAGVALPILFFLIPNLLTGSLVQFANDVFILPSRRFVYAAMKPAVRRAVFGLGADLLFIALALGGHRAKRMLGIIAMASFPVMLYLAAVKESVYIVAWRSAWIVEPLVVLFGVMLLLRGLACNDINQDQAERVFLVLSVTATCSLVQFPFAAAIYFCYVAPLVILSVVAVVSKLKGFPRLALLGAFCFYFFFAAFEVTPGFVLVMGRHYTRNIQTTKLDLQRAGGLRVSAETAKTYNDLGSFLAQHANGEYIYATPDCPEVYFLYGFRNPTRTLYDFLDDSSDRTVRILNTIHARNVGLVVLNLHPEFSESIPKELATVLEHEFPFHATVDKFEVRWKR